MTQRSPLARHVPDGRDPQQGAVGRGGPAEFRGRRRPVRDAAVRRLERSSARRARVDMLAARDRRRELPVREADVRRRRDRHAREEHPHRRQRHRAGRRAGVPPRRYDGARLGHGAVAARRRDPRGAGTRHGSVPSRVRGARHAVRRWRRRSHPRRRRPRRPTCRSPRSACAASRASTTRWRR